MDYLKTIEYRITPAKAYTIIRNCSGCGKKEQFISTGNFRVNANGRQLDVWLVYQCEKCKHTYNLPIFERISPEKIEKSLYQAFLSNDEEAALKYGTDINFFIKNRAEIDTERLEYTVEKLDMSKAEQAEAGKYDGERVIVVHNPYRLPIRTDKLLPELLNISRSQLKKMIKEEKISYEGVSLSEETVIRSRLNAFPEKC